MTKDQLIKEIQRTAKENGGVPLGIGKFSQETGVRKEEWLGIYWARWSDALREAGLTPNTLQTPYEEAVLFEKYVALTRERGRFPVPAELQLQSRKDPDFPSKSTFFNRFRGKVNLIARLAQYCQGRVGYEDIFALCNASTTSSREEPGISEDNQTIGYVYMIQHGSRREYKIGKTFNPVRREGEIALQLPEKLKPIHFIKTDDPSGIEKYWHSRFAEKRKEGEWFSLTATDVKAFKRWRNIF